MPQVHMNSSTLSSTCSSSRFVMQQQQQQTQQQHRRLQPSLSWMPACTAASLSPNDSEIARSLSFRPSPCEAPEGAVQGRLAQPELPRSQTFAAPTREASTSMDRSPPWCARALQAAGASAGVGIGACASFSSRPPPKAPNLTWVAPEDSECVPSGLRFISGSASRQHPAKVRTGIVNADVVEEGATHLGICDGVSGVQALGISPDELPRQLLRSCRTRLQSHAGQMEDEDDGTWFTGLIKDAYDDTEELGATTLLLAALRGSNLVTANLGDCALLVLRPCGAQPPLRLRPVFKTEPMRYDSRRPVQVQRLPGFRDENAHMVISEVMVSTTPIQSGDILVVGSDGLFDNLRDQDIQLAAEKFCASPPGAPGLLPEQDHLQRTAEVLVDLAIASVNLAAGNAADETSPGRNADDTTALVAMVIGSPEVGTFSDDDEEERPDGCSGLSESALGDTQASHVLRDCTNTVMHDQEMASSVGMKPDISRLMSSCGSNWSVENRHLGTPGIHRPRYPGNDREYTMPHRLACNRESGEECVIS